MRAIACKVEHFPIGVNHWPKKGMYGKITRLEGLLVSKQVNSYFLAKFMLEKGILINLFGKKHQFIPISRGKVELFS